jgi:diaminopimelate epimerase
MKTVDFVKAHAYGNDFLFVRKVDAITDGSTLARNLCNRKHGVGADGLILYALGDRSAEMDLYNADGGPSELSGNGLRCLAALTVRSQDLPVGVSVKVETGAGTKTLKLLARNDERYTFLAGLGKPGDVRRATLSVNGGTVDVSVLSMGNPQCVVLGSLPNARDFEHLGAALSIHSEFPAGTNVEFAHIESPELVRILIWERGVGPTTASGTGASAAAVVAAAHGGASRKVDVVSPGGTQRVEWRDDGVYLTGWAEVVLEGKWMGGYPTSLKTK